MKALKFAVIGTGFWSNYQISAWKEIEGVELVAVCNRSYEKAFTIAKKFQIPAVYTSVEDLFLGEELDFVDIITNVETHLPFAACAAGKGVDVICQKPMAPSLADAEQMLAICKEKNVGLFIHENFRFQAPIRKLKAVLESGTIGRAFKAKVSFCSAFPVFQNQPFLGELKHFIITDIGSHVMDICRFLFGEAKTLSCLTLRVNPTIQGEDVANVLMEMESGLHCFVEMSYASILEKETFPHTLALIEGEFGSLHLTNDAELKITTRKGTSSNVIKPTQYPWVDPDYAVVHSSIVDCNKDILNGLQGGFAETTGEDNLKTVQLVWACYESAKTKQVVSL